MSRIQPATIKSSAVLSLISFGVDTGEAIAWRFSSESGRPVIAQLEKWPQKTRREFSVVARRDFGMRF